MEKKSVFVVVADDSFYELINRSVFVASSLDIAERWIAERFHDDENDKRAVQKIACITHPDEKDGSRTYYKNYAKDDYYMVRKVVIDDLDGTFS